MGTWSESISRTGDPDRQGRPLGLFLAWDSNPGGLGQTGNSPIGFFPSMVLVGSAKRSESIHPYLGRVTNQVEHSTHCAVTDPSNKTTEFTYNAVGRTTAKVVSPSCGQQVTKWASRPTCLPPVRSLPNWIVGPWK